MLRVEMLPAGNGDSLWVEYGSASEIHRVRIDAGHASTYPHLRETHSWALPAAERVFELLIEASYRHNLTTSKGCASAVAGHRSSMPIQKRSGTTAGATWVFLRTADTPEHALGPKQGEFLGVLIEDKALPWNAKFGHGPVVVPPTGDLPRHEFDRRIDADPVVPYPESVGSTYSHVAASHPGRSLSARRYRRDADRTPEAQVHRRAR